MIDRPDVPPRHRRRRPRHAGPGPHRCPHGRTPHPRGGRELGRASPGRFQHPPRARPPGPVHRPGRASRRRRARLPGTRPGHPVRIRETLASLGGDGPVVLLGHSLGGVACVDLLAREELPRVASLITVGSQAPFFYELGASRAWPSASRCRPTSPAGSTCTTVRLPQLHRRGPLCRHRPAAGVVDVRVDNHQPFPRALRLLDEPRELGRDRPRATLSRGPAHGTPPTRHRPAPQPRPDRRG